ncbi:resolvase [Pseudidiomarina tainanensis]|uniref:Resolvase n=1 Tax=Pseudidiomarina tainanensis TaxID=502365 RepID=A0ACD2HG28_9GAMM|nr:recombinase family protein [Pseudidiomarina tainanensis]RZQ55445.1 resolvase [Pseudidiomarina tainanensis]
MQRIAYIRVSSADQNTERQLDGISYDKEFIDKCSGGLKQRPALDRLLEHVRHGDTVLVHSIDRMARNLRHLLELIDSFKAKGVTVEFVKECMRFTPESNNPMQDLMLRVMGAVGEFEKAMINERQREGIAQAKARGVYTGGKRKVNHKRVISLHQQGLKKAAIARDLGVHWRTVHRIIEASSVEGLAQAS